MINLNFVIKNNNHSVIRINIIVLLILLLLLGGCGGGSQILPPSDISFHLAMKAHEFMKVATLLLSQSPSFWGQGIRSLYYSALTLARLKNVSAFIFVTENFHTKVWAISPLPIRNYFSKGMKKLRTKYDYDVAEHDSIFDFNNFICNGVVPFDLLLNQAIENINKNYKNCKINPNKCDYCNSSKSIICLKTAAINEIEETRIALISIVAVK